MNNPPRAPAEKTTGLLLLGLGNVLLGDDGLGAVALARLESGYLIPAGVRLEDGGTLGLGLLGLLAEAEHVILVDAVRTDSPPGTLVRLDGDDVIPAVRDCLSPHQVGVAELLDAARLIGCYPATVTLIGLVPASIDLGLMRSTAVAASLDKLVEAIVREVAALGYPMVAQARTGLGSIRSLAGRFGM
ncbi:MAG: hydrogenase maturation protease [Alphaproteobacteria bacterium]|nr:hydrogenase maturation protease [Alphaproteobacteria bacterium]